MELITGLWLPILLSAVLVFVISSLIHMMIQYHKNDFRKLPNEDAVMDALRKLEIPEGDYMMPFAGSMKAMRSPEYTEKMKKGPVAVMTFLKCGKPGMGKSLVLWFLYSVVVSFFSAYICSRAVGGFGAPYLAVFRFVGASAFMGYSFAICQNSIWYGRNWGATIRSMFDGLVYALVTAGVFGWLWPR
jgi:hypothetical protein